MFNSCVRGLPKDQGTWRKGICLVTGVFGGEGILSGAIAILKISAKGPLIHFKIGRTGFFRMFIKIL